MKASKLSCLGLMGVIPACMHAQEYRAGDALRPNVIYVFPDQMRNSAMGFWNDPAFAPHLQGQADPVETPNLNRFANESVVFSSAMSNCPLSSPHRASLLTGMYPHRSGVPLNVNSRRPFSSLRDDATTVSDVFSQNGYDCAYIGKYHLDTPTPNDPENQGSYVEHRDPVWDAYTPPEKRHGFNFWYSYGTFDVHKNPHYWDTDGKRHDINQWSPSHETDMAISYLKNESGRRDASKPFFLMISMNPPHHPYHSLDDCMEDDYNLYKDRPLSQLLLRLNADTMMEKASSAAYYFAQISGVDREFGRLLDTLDELGLSKNTIVVFSSDHGETMCSHGLQDAKNSPYFESMNVPLLVRYPDRLKPRIVDYLLSSPDIMPTLLGLSNLSQQIPNEVQGTDFSQAMLTNQPDKSLPDGALYIRNMDGPPDQDGKVRTYVPVARGIKTHRYTLSLTIDKENKQLKEVLLFDDLDDPYQMHHIDWNTRPELKRQLLKQLGQLLKKHDDPWYKDGILKDLITYE